MSLDDERLASLLRRYAAFEEGDQGRILAAVVKNYRRCVGTDNPLRAERWERAVHELTADRLNLAQVVAVASRLSGGTAIVQLQPGSPTLLADLGTAVANLPSAAEPQVGLALTLHSLGLSPLLAYSFNAWQVDANSPLELGRRLGEFAVMCLYRLAELQAASDAGMLLASGAIANLVRSPGNRVTKLPRNFAARAVLLPQEYENFCWFARAGLGDRIPSMASFDADAASLSRSYVEGPDGETILRDWRELSPRQRADLRELYDQLQHVMAGGGHLLDLHPGNFVWDEGLERWILVDLGPVPIIGSEEYVVGSFEDYYRHTWLDRMRRERAEPVRSVDYDLGGASEPGDRSA